MIKDDVINVIDQLLPTIKAMLTGKYAIALGGSYAKGTSDIHSDLDFYVYTEGVVPLEERRRLVAAIADQDQEPYLDDPIDAAIWGGCADFYFKGIKVETSLKSYTNYEKSIQDCLEGTIFSEPTFWTLSGYYNYICLSEVSFIQPLDDRFGIIADWKKRIEVYPPKLKKAILDTNKWRGTFWLDNFHYLSAIKRCDTIYTSGIAQQTLHIYFQLLFALNETYFTGDKKIENQLRRLSFCPDPLLDNLDFLLGAHRDVKSLNRQRDLLKQIADSILKKIDAV
ncbi:nucleotidyltransferase domain-containing protein [Paenibacillus sp. GSMTC-2017]|uniref:nucleotidyltransferase family protein n=1 Tax=Paenibacillus sp. GSMTC-2017 TaxID=2794350 RepID=UPI0018D83F88|nr:nucleotidyltransferase domain-containing protein [Paenibacillus sp. GSMTC-2017]MBH5316451.1 nucleotidyltransferase domain-containing protein [Paenibacillus sp. GSMTC-2017]